MVKIGESGVYVNPDHVASVAPSRDGGGGSVVGLVTGMSLAVPESPKAIIEAMEKDRRSPPHAGRGLPPAIASLRLSRLRLFDGDERSR